MSNASHQEQLPLGSSSGYSPSPCTTSGPGFGYLSSWYVFGLKHPLLTSAKSIVGLWTNAMMGIRFASTEFSGFSGAGVACARSTAGPRLLGRLRLLEVLVVPTVGTDLAVDVATGGRVVCEFCDCTVSDDAAGGGASGFPPPCAMVTTAQFIKNSCSRFIQVQAKMASPLGRSLGTVKGNVCVSGDRVPLRCGQFPSYDMTVRNVLPLSVLKPIWQLPP
jgi:hypothetical protein